ncbi:MAG: UDP-2,3-diacylglucosamine diphosphatase [Bacteroides sp.]|nr:UDP-2,3-diacylglucosamine diphosphatase [Bacteroides sp.]MCM1413340.1 UDP-2,3-diacylglucosamine diphosphatase [Bacteroides sp.]MCM1471974.1 UDP-2,3-diacylglucosamine diphosphatase [Bacteroides sp.]
MTKRDKTYFISDLHIGAGYIPNRHDHERIIARWLREIEPTARRIYLLGDILDYWFEYRTVAPRGYVRFLGALAELADKGVEIIWAKGNHDIWIFDYLPDEIGLNVVDGVIDTIIDGKRFVMEHGDGVGEPRRVYRMMRSLFRCRVAQKLYASIHPRWTVGFAHRWSKHSRLKGQCEAQTTLSADDPLVKFAKEYSEKNGHVDYFIFGHRHILIDDRLSADTRLIVLGEGFRLMSYAVWDGFTLELKTIEK